MWIFMPRDLYGETFYRSFQNFLEYFVLNRKLWYSKKMKIYELAYEINVTENLHHFHIKSFWRDVEAKQNS